MSDSDGVVNVPTAQDTNAGSKEAEILRAILIQLRLLTDVIASGLNISLEDYSTTPEPTFDVGLASSDQ